MQAARELLSEPAEAKTATGGPPSEEAEPAGDQVLAISHSVLALDLTPYVDTAVWIFFGRKSMRANKFRTWIPGTNGTWISKEVSGPENHEQWLVSWRVFVSAALMLGICTRASLEAYELRIEKLCRL